MNTHGDLSGYRGDASEALKKVRARVGDIIRITKNSQTYEGTLIPRSEYGDTQHIVIKLKNGYNIGIKVTKKTQIERIGEGSKPIFTSEPLPKQNPTLPTAVILSTGGTIASRVDYRTGAVRPALTATDLYSVVPELAEIAKIDAKILLSLFSENIVPTHWTQIAKATADCIKQGVDGVVIAHGTDTMGYTAAALSFALQQLPIPVIVVGSQRSADRPSSDAATNLAGAVDAATRAPFAEVAVAMHETISDPSILIHKGTKVRKCHTSRRDTFRSINSPPIARIRGREITMLVDEYVRRDPTRTTVVKPDFEEKVALVKFFPGIDPEAIRFYESRHYRGLIIEGTGLGHVSKTCFAPIRDAVETGTVVAMTSQCIWGRVNMNVYDQGRDLLALGVIPLADMLPETALVKLMWVLGQTRDQRRAEELLKTNIAGEMTPRTLADEQNEVPIEN